MEAEDAFERAKDPALASGENRAPSKSSRARRLCHPPYSNEERTHLSRAKDGSPGNQVVIPIAEMTYWPLYDSDDEMR
jgi:hypothetical protein